MITATSMSTRLFIQFKPFAIKNFILTVWCTVYTFVLDHTIAARTPKKQQPAKTYTRKWNSIAWILTLAQMKSTESYTHQLFPIKAVKNLLCHVLLAGIIKCNPHAYMHTATKLNAPTFNHLMIAVGLATAYYLMFLYFIWTSIVLRAGYTFWISLSISLFLFLLRFCTFFLSASYNSRLHRSSDDDNAFVPIVTWSNK